MMKKSMRKRVAIILILALCMTLCPGMREEMPVKAAGTETVKAGAESGSLNRWTPTSSWEDEEVVAELDENNTDESGYTYRLYARASENTAELSMMGVARYQNTKEDIVVRVPDKVRKEGKEYTVTEFSPEPDKLNIKIWKKFRIYIGKNICDISQGSFNYRMVYNVHKKNANYKVEDGHLFSRDGKEFLRFNDDKYDADSVYVLPDTVEKLGSYAFYAANLKEVVLNSKIISISSSAFSNSTLQRIDLKNVKRIASYAFRNCRSLREVKINCKNVQIDQWSFAYSGIEHIYLPPGALMSGLDVFCNCERLETVIMGDGVQIDDKIFEIVENFFGGDYQLKTLILSNDISSISSYMLARCCSLRKLYIPDSIRSVETMGLRTCGELTLYGKKGSAAEQYDDDNVTFVDISEHKHDMKEVTFFEYDSWGVKGMYCEECAYGEDFEIVDYDTEAEKEQMPERLTAQDDDCPDVLELDEESRDRQGLFYELDDGTGTAAVKDIDDTNPFERDYFSLPETVKKDGKVYVLETIGEHALHGANIVIVSDTVRKIEEYGIANASGKIVLGKGVEEVDKLAFESSSAQIEIRGNNPNFKMIEDALYTADGKELIKYFGTKREFKVPTRVTEIWKGAFYNKLSLEKIRIYNCGRKIKSDNAVSLCDAEMVYEDEYTWYEDEDYIVEVDSQNKDANGWKYTLDGGTFTAGLTELNWSIYDSTSDEMMIKIPDKIRRNGRLYTVNYASLKPDAPTTYSDESCVRLLIGKYVNQIYIGQITCKMASYVHLGNAYFTSNRGSLFYDDGYAEHRLLRFYDETDDSDGSYTVPDGVSSVGAYAFAGGKLKKINLNDVRQVSKYAIYDCPNLEEVIMGEGVIVGAFAGCPSLKYLYLPKDTKLENCAFQDSSLEVVVMDESVKMDIDTSSSIFLNNYSLQTIILPEKMSALPYRTFWYCTSLEKIYIPSGVVQMGKECFEGMIGNVYAGEDSVAKENIGKSAHFVSLNGHIHDLRPVTFFAFDTWAVTGSYCWECAYGTTCKKVELLSESDKEKLPPILVPGEIPPMPSPSATPTIEPPLSSLTPTVTPSETPTIESTPSPSVIPSAPPPEETEEPTAIPPDETEEPTEIPSEETRIPSTIKPTFFPTAKPTEIPNQQMPSSSEVPEPTSQIIPGYSSSPPDSDGEDVLVNLRKSLLVSGLHISTKDNHSVTLRWKANTAARNYRIYRATRKNGTYKMIRMVGKSKNSYVDKKVKPLKRYYYKVTALGYHEGKVVEGSSTVIRSICVSGVRTPKIVVKKGQMELIRYVTVILKKYQGKYADIYIALPGKKFEKLKLVSNKISKYKGKFKIRYVVKKSTIRFKVRTYKKKGKKKWYSNFSSVVKVKV